MARGRRDALGWASREGHQSTAAPGPPTVLPLLYVFLLCPNPPMPVLSHIAVSLAIPARLSPPHNPARCFAPSTARLAADVAGVPTVLIARTDAHSANLLTSDIDDADKPFCTGKRTPEGFYYVNCGVKVGGRAANRLHVISRFRYCYCLCVATQSSCSRL